MGLFSNLRDTYITKPVVETVTNELVKVQNQSLELAKSQADTVQRFAQPLGFNDQYFQKKKPESLVTYDQLRSMSKLHDVSRSCINIRKRQITQLNWDITTINDDIAIEQYKNEIPTIKAFFSTIGGYNVKMRRLLDMIVEDFLVLDATVFERRRTRNGAFLGLLPTDPATFKIRVSEAGTTPPPPEVAYEQWIRGSKVGEFTADQIIYEMLNPRTDSPYGFSVMEALVMTVEESLRARMSSLSHFTDGSTPDGFYEIPENWSLEQIKSFQSHFDSLMAGDARMQHRVKFMPATGGKGWQPTKDFDFSGLQPYLDWLMRITAGLFGISPQELGFTDKLNRANAEEQTEISKRNSIKPMAGAIEEIFNEILWTEQLALTDASGKVTGVIGPFPDLQFTFLDLDKKDELVDSQVTDTMVKIGALSVDEWRKDKGMKPLGLEPYILTAQGPVLVKDVVNGTFSTMPPEVSPTDPTSPVDTKPTESSVKDQEDARNTTPAEELKRWEKKALADLKEGRSFRKFSSEVLDDFTATTLAHDLTKCTDKSEIKALFATYQHQVTEGILADAERLFKKLDQLDPA